MIIKSPADIFAPLDPVIEWFADTVLDPVMPFVKKAIVVVILGMLLFVVAGYTIMGVAKFVRFAAQGIREGLKPPAATNQTQPKNANPAPPAALSAPPAQSALKAYLEMRTRKYRP